MNWNGIVDGRLYSLLLEPLRDSVAVLASDHEQVVRGDLFRILFGRERDSFYAFEIPPVEAGNSPSKTVPLVEPSKLDPADRGVNSIQPRRISDTRHFAFRRPPAIAAGSSSIGKIFVVGRYHATVTADGHVLAIVERKKSR